RGVLPKRTSAGLKQCGQDRADKTVQLWDAQTGAAGLILTGHTDGVLSVAYSPSGHQLASGSSDNAVRLWDAQTGAPLSVLEGHSNPVSSVAYSPSGHQIASSSSDKTVRIWDVESGACSLVLSGHTSEVCIVAYSRNGQRIVSCSTDDTVQIWDALSGDCLTTMHDFDVFLNGPAWRDTDAGTYIATGSSRGKVRLWRLIEREGKPLFNLQWSSPHDSLNVEGANIQNANGLDRMQIQLLKQRGNVGEPIPPTSIRTASKKLISMAAVVNRLSLALKAGAQDNVAEKAIEESKLENPQKDVTLLVEE
ncbi:hypothetical protein BGZ70_000278, partial [Mortierella alpina]